MFLRLNLRATSAKSIEVHKRSRTHTHTHLYEDDFLGLKEPSFSKNGRYVLFLLGDDVTDISKQCISV